MIYKCRKRHVIRFIGALPSLARDVLTRFWEHSSQISLLRLRKPQIWTNIGKICICSNIWRKDLGLDLPNYLNCTNNWAFVWKHFLNITNGVKWKILLLRHILLIPLHVASWLTHFRHPIDIGDVLSVDFDARDEGQRVWYNCEHTDLDCAIYSRRALTREKKPFI